MGKKRLGIAKCDKDCEICEGTGEVYSHEEFYQTMSGVDQHSVSNLCECAEYEEEDEPEWDDRDPPEYEGDDD